MSELAGRGWRDLPRGGYILKAGSARDYETGDWRTHRPLWDEEKCIHCLRCWVHCPDSAVMVEDGKVVGIDYAHCKGCGICVEECPDRVRALKMVQEGQASPSDSKE